MASQAFFDAIYLGKLRAAERRAQPVDPPPEDEELGEAPSTPPG